MKARGLVGERKSGNRFRYACTHKTQKHIEAATKRATDRTSNRQPAQSMNDAERKEWHKNNIHNRVPSSTFENDVKLVATNNNNSSCEYRAAAVHTGSKASIQLHRRHCRRYRRRRRQHHRRIQFIL